MRIQSSYIKQLLFDCLFPVFCYGCQKEGELVCARCKKRLNAGSPVCFICGKMASLPGHVPGATCAACRRHSPIRAFLSFFRYDDPLMRLLIHEYKYKRVKVLADLLASLWARSAKQYGVNIPHDTLIIPIPLYKTRERLRGFNQTALLAKCLALRFQAEFRDDIIYKIKKTRPQVGLLGEERRKNIEGSFALRKPALLKERTILLLDDVKTTGATLNEAALLLKQAGAHQVWAATLAR